MKSKRCITRNHRNGSLGKCPSESRELPIHLEPKKQMRGIDIKGKYLTVGFEATSATLSTVLACFRRNNNTNPTRIANINAVTPTPNINSSGIPSEMGPALSPLGERVADGDVGGLRPGEDVIGGSYGQGKISVGGS